MIPDPLHPAIVHLPIALALLLPLCAIVAVIAIRVGFVPPRAWLAVLGLQVVFVVSAWAALETGEDQGDRVERVVAERHIHEHEEAGERLLGVGVAALVVSAVGLLGGGFGRAGRIATVLVSFAVLGFGIRSGHSGGELVYRHGAARAYIDTAAAAPARAPSSVERPEREARLHEEREDD